jgi:predicted ArsR family transcriptional regulator
MARKKSPAGKPATAARGKKSSKPTKTTKLARLETMLRQPDGATIEQLSKALDWQSHSVRGAIAGALKKKGCVVTNTVDESKGRIYRIS